MLCFSKPRTTFVLTILTLTTICFVLSILVLVAGVNVNTLKNLSIITFDTSSVTLDLQRSLGYSITPLPDWFEPHYLSVCHGLWQTPQTHVKNLATATCEGRSAGYTFSLAAELAAKAPIRAAAFFNAWPTTYGTFVTGPSLGLLASAIGLMAISAVAYTGGLVLMWNEAARIQVNILRVAFLAGVVGVILLTNSAAQITAKVYKTRGVAPAGIPVGVTSSTDRGFFVVIWLATALGYISIILSVILAFRLRTSVMQQLRDGSAGRRDSPKKGYIELIYK